MECDLKKILLIIVLSMIFSLLLGRVIYIFIIFPIFMMIYLAYSVYRKKEIQQFINSLTSIQLENLEKELNHPLMRCKNNFVLTDHYILKLDNLALFKYSDILLMYKYNDLESRGVNEYLVLITRKAWYKFRISSTILSLNYEMKDFSKIIREKNPKVLEGNTEENKRKLKMEYDIEL